MTKDTSISLQYTSETENTNRQLLTILKLETAEIRSFTTGMHQILFITKGQCDLTCNIFSSTTIHSGEAVFLPADTRFKLRFSASSHAIILSLDPFQSLPGSYSIEELFTEYHYPVSDRSLGVLSLKEAFFRFLSDLEVYLQGGLFNELFYDIKIKELLFILYAYYEKRELCEFLKPILNNDYLFAEFVLSNWKKVKNAKQLAELSSYCETAFNKKFKKTFGITPYKWLNEKKAARILYDIANSDTSFKVLAEEYGFNSQQQFNDYCTRNFKITPGKIRRR